MAERTRVLCVDDHPDAADSTGAVLELRGFEAVACHDGPAALAALAGFRPHVCVLDMTMLGMDGVELAGRIRAEVGGAVRMVALTGRWDVTARHQTRNAAFDEHLVKPVDPDRLAAVVTGLVAPA